MASLFSMCNRIRSILWMQIVKGICVMTKRKVLVERRKHKRFQVQDGIFAVLRCHWPCSTRLGPIIDVSKGGLAFRYIDIASEEGSNGSFELVILLANNSFHLDKVPFETISDFEIGNEVPFSCVKTRRRGVQFGELTHEQIFQIEYFIRNHTISEV